VFASGVIHTYGRGASWSWEVCIPQLSFDISVFVAFTIGSYKGTLGWI
jgi:hypothetical protein